MPQTGVLAELDTLFHKTQCRFKLVPFVVQMAESVVGCRRRRERMTTAPFLPQLDGTVKRLGGLVQVAPFHLHSTESTERLQRYVEVTPCRGYLVGIP